MAKSYLVYSGSVFPLKLNLYFSCDQVDCSSDYKKAQKSQFFICIKSRIDTFLLIWSGSNSLNFDSHIVLLGCRN